MTIRISTIKNSLLFFALALIASNSFGQLAMVKQDGVTIQEPEGLLVKNDPKESLKALFENSFTSTAKTTGLKKINTEHLNPNAITFVQDYIARHSDYLMELQTWARPYFDMMDDVLTKNGIPKQLKYLAVIESNLKASVVSWAGAVGPWQFMPGTARELGLNIGGMRDERRDYLKSTMAASKYLNYLFGLYNDWLLVVAAYNCGPGRVNSAISRAGSDNFWDLQYYLPAESRNHVKKFIATHYIMEGQGGVTTVTKDKATAMMETVKDDGTNQNVKVQTIAGRYNSKAVAKYLEMNIADFNKLNPGMDKILATSSTYQLKLPPEKAELFLLKKNDMLNESIQMILNPEYKN